MTNQIPAPGRRTTVTVMLLRAPAKMALCTRRCAMVPARSRWNISGVGVFETTDDDAFALGITDKTKKE